MTTTTTTTTTTTGAAPGRSTTGLVGELLATSERCLHREAACAPPMDVHDIAAILSDGRARFPHVTLTLDGHPVAPSRFCSDRTINGTPVSGLLDLAKVERLLADGASIVLNELETYWPALVRLCADVRATTGIDVGAMAFVSPPGLGAFPLHQDPVHVVVIQCSGTKDWSVFDHFAGQDGAGPVERPDGVQPRHRLRFAPGDVFSMPAGHPHQAASSDDWSVHVSLTVRRPDPAQDLRTDIRAAVAEVVGTTEDPAALRTAFLAAMSRVDRTARTADEGSENRLLARERLAAVMGRA